jgi:hypothetical protein
MSECIFFFGNHRIDENHCNTKQVWQSLGSPLYPTPKQLHLLRQASEFQPEKIATTGSATAGLTFSTSISPQAVVQFVLKL